MRHPNLKRQTLSLFAGGLLSLASLYAGASPSLANTPSSNARQGLPGRRISGGSRSPNTACLATPDQPVVALMPKSNLGLTLSERPTFWFSLPAISPDRTLEFGLYDQEGELIYKENFGASGEAGISSLSLPNTFAPLSEGKNYRWYLSVVCDPDSRSEDLVVTGWIRRNQADRDLATQLADATPQERLSVYESSDIWFETLTTLAELHRLSPSSEGAELSLDEKWQGLLEAVDLTQVATVPFSSKPIF